MNREFIATRVLFGSTGVALAVWALVSILGPEPSEAPKPDAPDGMADDQRADSLLRSSWEEELLAPEIQDLWRERRLLLAEVSRRYREETDPGRAVLIRRSMDSLIAVAERDVNDLRRQQTLGTEGADTIHARPY